MLVLDIGANNLSTLVCRIIISLLLLRVEAMWGPMAGLATVDARPHGGSPHTPYAVTGIAIGVLPLGVGLLYRF